MNPRRIVRLYDWYKAKTFCCAFFAAAMLTMVAAATIVRFPPVYCVAIIYLSLHREFHMPNQTTLWCVKILTPEQNGHNLAADLFKSLQWRQNERGSVSNHQRPHCLLNCRFRRRSKKTSKLHVTGLCVGEIPAQKASNAENVPIWWRHHVLQQPRCCPTPNHTSRISRHSWLNILRPRRNFPHFAGHIFKCISLNKIYAFRLRLHWSLFLRFELTIFQHWYR